MTAPRRRVATNILVQQPGPYPPPLLPPRPKPTYMGAPRAAATCSSEKKTHLHDPLP
jgi:hypothetical protein